MLDRTASPPEQTSVDREARRHAILHALRADAEGVLGRMADALADLPDGQAFGQIEYDLRDLAHELAASAHQAGLQAGKKRGM